MYHNYDLFDLYLPVRARRESDKSGWRVARRRSRVDLSLVRTRLYVAEQQGNSEQQQRGGC